MACSLVDKEETRRFFFLAESQTNLRRAVKKRYSTISFRANLYAEIASTEWAVKAELHIRVRFITTIFAYPNVASVQSAIWAECKNSLSKIYVTSFLILVSMLSLPSPTSANRKVAVDLQCGKAVSRFVAAARDGE